MICSKEFFDLISYKISNGEISVERFSKQFIEYSIWDRISSQFYSYLSIKRHFKIVSIVWLVRSAWLFADEWYAMIISSFVPHWLKTAFQKSELNFESRSLINRGLARSETSTRCRSGNGSLGLANIWSRLLKHNWWDFLYERVRTHSDVFFDFKFNENSFLYDYINRASSEFQFMHVYGQQLCFLFHRCGSPLLFLDSWR